MESMTSRNISYTLDELLMIDPETISLIISGTVPALVTSSPSKSNKIYGLSLHHNMQSAQPMLQQHGL